MELKETNVVLRKLIASEGMVLTDVETERLRSKEIYLGTGDDSANYKEIDENTPLPEPEEPDTSEDGADTKDHTGEEVSPSTDQEKSDTEETKNDTNESAENTSEDSTDYVSEAEDAEDTNTEEGQFVNHDDLTNESKE